MSRTIAVKGVGSLRVKPDYVVIGLELEAKNEVYERAMSLSSEQIEELTQALIKVGFTKEELKELDCWFTYFFIIIYEKRCQRRNKLIKNVLTFIHFS